MPIEASISRILIYCAAASVMAPEFPVGPSALAEQPRSQCHSNPDGAADQAAVAARGDIVDLPRPLENRITRLAERPHTFLPIQACAEADKPSQLFQYYLLDTTGFQPNFFTAKFRGVNNTVQLTATGAD
jgi:hypothetical protein